MRIVSQSQGWVVPPMPSNWAGAATTYHFFGQEVTDEVLAGVGLGGSKGQLGCLQHLLCALSMNNTSPPRRGREEAEQQIVLVRGACAEMIRGNSSQNNAKCQSHLCSQVPSSSSAPRSASSSCKNTAVETVWHSSRHRMTAVDKPTSDEHKHNVMCVARIELATHLSDAPYRVVRQSLFVKGVQLFQPAWIALCSA